MFATAPDPLSRRWRRAAMGAVFACLMWSAAQPVQSSESALGLRDFERAVVLYGGANQENLVGSGCSGYGANKPPNRGSAAPQPGVPETCRVRYSPTLDEPFANFPVVMFHDRSHRYYGRVPQRPVDSRGVYIYRFDAGRLANNGQGHFRTVAAEPGQTLKVRAGDVVTWSAIVSNVENDLPHETIALREIVVTPAGTRIHHCSKWALNGCDPINPKAATFGLCEGRVRQYDGRGGQADTAHKHFQPMLDTYCEAVAIIDEGARWRTVFQTFKAMPQGEGSVSSVGNSWTVEERDPPGPYRIEVRLSGKLVGQLSFEVVR